MKYDIVKRTQERIKEAIKNNIPQDEEDLVDAVLHYRKTHPVEEPFVSEKPLINKNEIELVGDVNQIINDFFIRLQSRIEFKLDLVSINKNGNVFVNFTDNKTGEQYFCDMKVKIGVINE